MFAPPLFAASTLLLLGLAPAPARAAEPATAKSSGVAVLVLGEAELGALSWALAREVYAAPALFPPGMNEARARSLVGQSRAASTPETPDTTELAELRDGVHDEGTVSRRVLSAIASTTRAAAVAVVRAAVTPGHVQVRLYLADRAAFDVSLYDGDPRDPSWRSDVVHALEGRFGPRANAAPAAKLKAAKTSETGSRPFYASPWFWGAIGGAALLGGTALVATKLTASDDVHVRVEPPTAASAALRF